LREIPRIERLQAASPQVSFLSIEPLLENLGLINLKGISWVIVGGESGPGARPMKREWVIAIKEQCQRAGVPFFFKQWGGVRKANAGRLLDDRTYDEYPAREHNEVLPDQERLTYATAMEASVAQISATL